MPGTGPDRLWALSAALLSAAAAIAAASAAFAHTATDAAIVLATAAGFALAAAASVASGQRTARARGAVHCMMLKKAGAVRPGEPPKGRPPQA